jgi:hypothetical protein
MRHWLSNAIATIRDGLVPHLSAPKLFGVRSASERSFPTNDELYAMQMDPRDGNVLIEELVDWRARRPNPGG